MLPWFTAVGAVGILTAFTGTLALCGRTRPVATSFREGEVIMEVLSSRVLVRPTDFERSLRFYAESLGLHVYRKWSSGSTRGVVFFLGGGFLELSGSSRTGTSEGRSMVAGERRRRCRTRTARGRSGYYRASDRQAVGVEGDAGTRPRRVEYCERRGPRDPSAPTSLSWVAFLSAATPSLGAAE
jgi:catechol 2,3-dioxygenase-like lactoylglutathione lyase family enzyme